MEQTDKANEITEQLIKQFQEIKKEYPLQYIEAAYNEVFK